VPGVTANTHTLKVRKLYVKLLKITEISGYARKASQTPLEYLPYIIQAVGKEFTEHVKPKIWQKRIL